MRIVCPSCAAAYELPADRLKQRRTVRCARCGGQWVAGQDIQEASPIPQPAATLHAPLPAVTAMDRLAAAAATRKKRPAALIAAWVATFLVLGGAVAAVLIWRAEVVEEWPPSALILGTPGSQPAGLGSTATGTRQK